MLYDLNYFFQVIVIIFLQLDPQFWLGVNVYFISIFFNILEQSMSKKRKT